MIRGPRITLRRWRDADLEPFAQMNANPEVMRLMPKPLDAAESAVFLQRIRESFAKQGFGLWALDVGGSFAGYVGLSQPRFEAPFTPCWEVGWRLRRAYWGHGYATEGGLLSLGYAFRDADIEEVVSFAALDNARSRRVMERLGMARDPAEDFDHPLVEAGHPLARHCLYRLRRSPAVLARIEDRLAAFARR